MAWRSAKGRAPHLGLRSSPSSLFLLSHFQHLQHLKAMRTSFVLLPALAMAALAAPAPGQLDKRQNIIGCVLAFKESCKSDGKGWDMLLSRSTNHRCSVNWGRTGVEVQLAGRLSTASLEVAASPSWT